MKVSVRDLEPGMVVVSAPTMTRAPKRLFPREIKSVRPYSANKVRVVFHGYDCSPEWVLSRNAEVEVEPAAPEATLALAINAHRFTGVKRQGKWSFACPSWPDVATACSGSESSAEAIAEFTRLALAECVTVTVRMLDIEGV